METLDVTRIKELLPHRYPFLMVDRVLEYETGVSLTAIKNVTINEPFFIGHFPVKPVMPGVLIMEALAQTGGLLAFMTSKSTVGDSSVLYLVGMDDARFKRPVEPGDQLLLKAEIVKVVRGIWKFKGTASVDGQLVASATLMCAEREA